MTESSIPFVLFHDQPVKVLRIILRDRFAANANGDQFYRRSDSDSIWERCTRQSWYDGVRELATSYMHKYGSDSPVPDDIDRATQYLFHRNIYNKIHGNARGYSMA